MIMKMTSSTSRMSISGTTFISETIPRLPPTTPMPMSHLACLNFPARRTPTSRAKTFCDLLPCFELGGNQTHLINACAVHDVNRARHLHEQNVVIALNESHLLGAVLEHLFNARPETIPSGVLVIDLDFAVLHDLHDHGLVFKLLVLLLVRRRLRHQRIQPLGRQGRDHHENNNKHQKNVDQWHNIRRRQCSRTATYIHPHCEISCRAAAHPFLSWRPRRVGAGAAPDTQQTNVRTAKALLLPQSPVGAAAAGVCGLVEPPACCFSVSRPNWSTPAERISS